MKCSILSDTWTCWYPHLVCCKFMYIGLHHLNNLLKQSYSSETIRVTAEMFDFFVVVS